MILVRLQIITNTSTIHIIWFTSITASRHIIACCNGIVHGRCACHARFPRILLTNLELKTIAFRLAVLTDKRLTACAILRFHIPLQTAKRTAACITRILREFYFARSFATVAMARARLQIITDPITCRIAFVAHTRRGTAVAMLMRATNVIDRTTLLSAALDTNAIIQKIAFLTAGYLAKATIAGQVFIMIK